MMEHRPLVHRFIPLNTYPNCRPGSFVFFFFILTLPGRYNCTVVFLVVTSPGCPFDCNFAGSSFIVILTDGRDSTYDNGTPQ